jgi:hypothetical protein
LGSLVGTGDSLDAARSCLHSQNSTTAAQRAMQRLVPDSQRGPDHSRTASPVDVSNKQVVWFKKGPQGFCGVDHGAGCFRVF